ncbi:MAG: hypothetical protein H7338_19580, partial [Candidatus Sericytochromatia bacterium]|nr:hypothetical protein [Candidatus Sericytochromatia bacterium]
MTHDPWLGLGPTDEPPQAALASVDLTPKSGGYSLADILKLHDSALHFDPADIDALPTTPFPSATQLPTVGALTTAS